MHNSLKSHDIWQRAMWSEYHQIYWFRTIISNQASLLPTKQSKTQSFFILICCLYFVCKALFTFQEILISHLILHNANLSNLFYNKFKQVMVTFSLYYFRQTREAMGSDSAEHKISVECLGNLHMNISLLVFRRKC